MPAPWAAGAQARIIGEIHGSQTVNVMHFATNTNVDDPGTLDTLLLQLAEALLDCAVQTLIPAVTSDWKLVRCDAKRIYQALGDPIVATAPANTVGQLSPTSVSFAASLVHLRSGIDGRKGRGRLFLPPPGEGEVTASDMDGPTAVAIAAFLACVAGKFLGNGATTPWRLGVLSRKDLNGNLANFNNSFRVVASMNPVVTLAKIGSRKKGRGA